MIIDSLDNMYRYLGAIPQLGTVISILKKVDLKTLPCGQYKTTNPLVRYNVFEYDANALEAEKQEIHERDMDVQIDISGEEGYLAAVETGEITEEYDAEKDASFQKVDPRVSFKGDPSMFTIFFPGEPHTASLKVGEGYKIKKCVFKVIF